MRRSRVWYYCKIWCTKLFQTLAMKKNIRTRRGPPPPSHKYYFFSPPAPEKHMESGCTPKPSPAPIFMQGYEGDAGGMFVGRGWRNDDTPGKKKSFSFSESRPDRPKRRSSLSERSAVGEEEEERKERTPAHMVRTCILLIELIATYL